MALNIHNVAEPDMTDTHQICVGGFCFSDQFQQLLAAQAALAFDNDPDLTVWMSLSDSAGNAGIVRLLNPRMHATSSRGLTTLSQILSRGPGHPGRVKVHDIGAMRATGIDIIACLSENLGALASIPLAPEMAQVSAVLWFLRRSPDEPSGSELARIGQLASVLGASLDREVDLMLRDRAQQTEQRMTDLAHRVADLFAAPGIPISSRFRALLDQCCAAFDMQSGYVTLISQGRSTIRFQSTGCGPGPTDTPPPTLPTFSAVLIRDPHPLDLWNVGTSAHAGLVDLSGAPAGRFLGCPIRFDGRTHGTIEFVGNAPARVPYTQLERAMLSTLSVYASGPLVLLNEASRY